jgi:hypothetical protein
MLSRSATEVGARVVPNVVHRRHAEADTWLARYGITIDKNEHTPTRETT